MSEMRRNKPYDMFGIRLHSDSNVKIDARELYLLKRLGMKVTQVCIRWSKAVVLYAVS